MKTFTFLLFVLLFIAVVCFPVFSKSTTRNWDSGRYMVTTRTHVQWLGSRSDHSARGLSRAWLVRSCAKWFAPAEESPEKPEEVPGKIIEEPAVVK